MKDYTKHIPGVIINEAELRVDIPRPDRGDKIRYLLLGADNPTAILGMYFDGVVLDEYAEMDPQVWTRVLRPTLSDRLGWALFIGTPRGQNHFYDVLEIAKKNENGNWYWRRLKASETGIVAQSELDEAKNTMSPEEYEQEFECSFTAALLGAYYGKEMENAELTGRVGNVPYDPSLSVETAWDLGVGDTTVIWFFQQCGHEIRAIDYIEDSGRGLDYYAKLLRERPYSYEAHHLPHDVVARDMSTGHSRQETLRGLGVTNIRIVPKLLIDDRINASRILIPRVWFDRKKCERGIAALKNYERKWNAKNKIFESAPLHNWASHCFTGDTKVLTRSGVYAISCLPKEGHVLTLSGWKKYLNPRVTQKNVELVEVVFKNGYSVKCTPEHSFMTAKGWKFAKDLEKGLQIRSGLTFLRYILMVGYIAYGQMINILLGVVKLSIEAFGQTLMAKFLRDLTSTIRIMIIKITTLKILSVFQLKNICLERGMKLNIEDQSVLLKVLEIKQPNGISLKPVGFGTKEMLKEVRVGPNGEESLGIAQFVKKSLTVLLGKVVTLKNIAQDGVSTLSIEEIKNLSTKEDVWCLTVPNYGHFSLLNGAIVHNCADAFGYFALNFRELSKKTIAAHLPRQTESDYDILG